MTKRTFMDLMAGLDDNDEINLDEMQRDLEEAESLFIEELEERQSATGFYAFQDLMAARRAEW